MTPDEIVDAALASAAAADASRPRSLQDDLGPSDIGQPCDRRLALSAVRRPRGEASGQDSPGSWWPRFVGVAVHAELEKALRPKPGWLTESSVEVSPSVSGSADLFHIAGGVVIDWKVVGDYTLNKARREGPSRVYRRQAHLYGRGFVNAGYDVSKVGIVFLPRASALPKQVRWFEDYDPEVAALAVDRWDRIRLGARAGGGPFILATPKEFSECRFCPFLDYEDSVTSCSGRPAAAGPGAGGAVARFTRL